MGKEFCLSFLNFTEWTVMTEPGAYSNISQSSPKRPTLSFSGGSYLVGVPFKAASSGRQLQVNLLIHWKWVGRIQQSLHLRAYYFLPFCPVKCHYKSLRRKPLDKTLQKVPSLDGKANKLLHSSDIMFNWNVRKKYPHSQTRFFRLWQTWWSSEP